MKKCEYLHDGKDYGKVLGKMLNNKVEIAYQILIQEMDLEIPNYIKEAFEWINRVILAIAGAGKTYTLCKNIDKEKFEIHFTLNQLAKKN